MDDNLFQIGEKRFAEVATYRGKTSLDMREWYPKKDGSGMARTQKGVKLTFEEWEDFKANWEEFVKFVDNGFNNE